MTVEDLKAGPRVPHPTPLTEAEEAIGNRHTYDAVMHTGELTLAPKTEPHETIIPGDDSLRPIKFLQGSSGVCLPVRWPVPLSRRSLHSIANGDFEAFSRMKAAARAT